MGQLKPSEVRLLAAFFGTVLILGSFFLYEWYMRELAQVKSTLLIRQEQRDSLITMREQQDEYNQKRVWLNQHQPLARDEFEAREALDRVVSLAGIEAAGLTLMNTPPERPPRLESYYWAFERRVVVEGDIQNIVQWLTSLQSESSFRAVTQLHIVPKKRTEPEVLTCEVTIEQRYVTEDILNMTNVAVVSQPAAAPMDQVSTRSDDAENGDPSGAGDSTPDDTEERGPVVMPPTGGSTPAVTRPRVRMPVPSENESPPAEPDGPDQTRVRGAPGGGVLSGASRGPMARGTTAPPPMPSDLAQAEEAAEANGETAPVLETGIEPVPDAGDAIIGMDPPEPEVIRVDSGEEQDAPGPRGTYDTESHGGIVGEPYDVDTPGAGGPESRVGIDADADTEIDVDVEDYSPDTN